MNVHSLSVKMPSIANETRLLIFICMRQRTFVLVEDNQSICRKSVIWLSHKTLMTF